MSQLTDLASSFGIPVVVVSIAGSIYWALSEAEKVARPEALAEISAVLKDPSWSRSMKPWSIVERLFVWTFGERHFSIRCITRSATSTVIMVTSLIIFHVLVTGDLGFSGLIYLLKDASLTAFIAAAFLLAVLAGFIPDYVALLKTRAFLKMGHKYPAIVILCLDAVSSIAISLTLPVLITLTSMPSGHPVHPTPHTIAKMDAPGLREIASLINPASEFRNLTTGEAPLYPAFYFSTLFTSIWLALIVISSTILKFLAPLQRFTTWFFDVEKHPLEAVGIVTGALVMLGAAIWAVVQKL